MTNNLNDATTLRLFTKDDKVLQDVRVRPEEGAIHVAKTVFSHNASVEFIEFIKKEDGLNVAIAVLDRERLENWEEQTFHQESGEAEEVNGHILNVTTDEPADDELSEQDHRFLATVAQIQEKFLGKLVQHGSFQGLSLSDASALSGMVAASYMEASHNR